MNFDKEQSDKISKIQTGICALAYEKHQLLSDLRMIKDRLDVIDETIGKAEAAISSINQTRKDFNTYLVVKEGAIPAEDLIAGINGGQLE